MRTRPHSHPCAFCGVKTECCGDVEQNYDGWPEWICLEYHKYGAGDIRCDECERKQDDEARRVAHEG